MEAIKSAKGNLTESKHERFVRIAERRVNKILDSLDSLGKCSNKKNYEYTVADVSKIFQTIEKKTKGIKALYQDSNQKNNSFRLHN